MLLEVSIDDSCTVDTDIVVLTNKTSTHTPSKRDDKGYQYVVPIVLPRDSLHNMKVGGGSVSRDISPHNNRLTAKYVMKSYCDLGVSFISSSPNPSMPVMEVQSD